MSLIDDRFEVETTEQTTTVNKSLERRRHPAQNRVTKLRELRTRAERASEALPYVATPEPFPNIYHPHGFDLWLPQFHNVDVFIIPSQWPKQNMNDEIAIRCFPPEDENWPLDYRQDILGKARGEAWLSFYAWLAKVEPHKPDLWKTITWSELCELVRKNVKAGKPDRGGRTREKELSRRIQFS